MVAKTLILLTAFGKLLNPQDLTLATARAIVVPRQQGNSSEILPGTPCDDEGSIYCGFGADAVCTKIMTDINSCGHCVYECQAGQTCEKGICTNKECPPGWKHCLFNPNCVDLQNDSNNCGVCNNKCPGTLTCQDGNCHFPPGDTQVGGAPKPTSPPPETEEPAPLPPTPSSPRPEPTPSAIGETCDLPAHPGGIWCPTADGGLKCVDYTFDPYNCGGCSGVDPKYRCAVGSSCQAGKCVAAEPTTTDGGEPSTPAPSATEKPQEPKEPEIGPGVPCNYGAKGFVYCSATEGPGFQCFNTLNDNRHCGKCGNSCGAGQNCVDGACGPAGGCGAQTYCPGSANGRCVNLDNDNNNCGACGKFCKAGKNCVGGKCV